MSISLGGAAMLAAVTLLATVCLVSARNRHHPEMYASTRHNKLNKTELLFACSRMFQC